MPINESTPVEDSSLDPPAQLQRHPDVQTGWLTRPTVSAADLDWVPLFAGMEPGCSRSNRSCFGKR